MKVVKFAFSLFGINTYLVVDEATGKCAVIDPGMIDDEEREAFTGYIKRNNLTLTHVINTHLHVDHAIGDAFVAREYGVPVAAHEGDLFLGERIKEQAHSFGIREAVEDFEVTERLEPGDIIKIGEGELEVIHVPGHSPGGIALYDRKDGFVIAGDSLFAGSIGRTDLPGGNHAQLIAGIKNGLLTLPPSTVVYPGHGPATTISREAASNPFLC